jgi:hypothetical protein
MVNVPDEQDDLGGFERILKQMLTRRTFLDSLIGVAVLTPMTGGIATAAAGQQRAPLLLWDNTTLGGLNPAVPGMSLGQITHAGLRDDAWKHEVEELFRQDKVSSITVVGKPATVFVVNQTLGRQWRVISQGIHGRGVPDEHILTGPAPLIAQLAGNRRALSTPGHYAAALNEQMASCDGPTIDTMFQAGTWHGGEVSSFFALPRRSVV